MGKKRGRNIKININMPNRLLYTLILIGILIAVGVGVYAATYTASGAGHPYTEISTCAANQSLKMNAAGNAWTCSDDVVGITKEYADANYKDPPGQWTCTLRTRSVPVGYGVNVSCVNPEKIITGGCGNSGSSGGAWVGRPMYTSAPGWFCPAAGGTTGTLNLAYAYCCL
jgi:hypothetical protein